MSDLFNISGNDKLLARAGMIKVHGHNIETPFNMPTSADLNKLQELRKVRHLQRLKFCQPISEVNIQLSENKIKSLLTNKSATDTVIEQVADDCDMAGVSLFRPLGSRDIIINKKLNTILTEIQIQAVIDFITVSDISRMSSPAAFDKRINRTREYIENYHDSEKYCAIIPVLRLDAPLDFLKQKIAVAQDSGFEGIVFIHSPYYYAKPSYTYIQKIAQETEMWFHLSGCHVTWNKNKTTSLTHAYLPFAFDSFSIHPKKLHIDKNKTTVIKVKPKPAFVFKRFNNTNWGITDQNNWADCICDVCKGHKDSASWIGAYNGASIASPALRYHNLSDGFMEFMKARKYMLTGDFRDYAKTKKYMVEAVKGMFGIDLSLKNLQKWF